MSNGDPSTAPTPTWGDPPNTYPPNTYPLAPPSAALPAPPTAPVAPPLAAPGAQFGYPSAPSAPTGRIPVAPGWPVGPGDPAGPPGQAPPGGWRPQGPAEPPRRSGRGRGAGIALLLVLALLAGLAGGFGLARVGRSGGDLSASSETPPVTRVPSGDPNGSSTLPSDPTSPGGSAGVDEGQNGQGSQGTSPSATADVDKVAAAVTPGVVNINVLTPQGQGAGTGMVLSADGLVLTNNHVVRGSTRIVVIDADSGDRYDAKVLGTAPTKDVALIKLVGAKGMATVRTGDSDTVKVGDPVVALGNAGGRGGTPSVVPGNVVALGRSITASDQSGQESQRLSNLIQTDANIVPGDSGGPLADANGAVIAVNSAASVTNQTSATGEGYAIPINDALRIVEQIKAGRGSDVVHIGTRGVLGVQVSSVASDPFGASGSGQSVPGAAVAGVADGSGAQKAGLVAGSTITALDGRAVTSAEGLTTALANAKPGDKVTLTWSDPDGQSHTATISLIPGPPD